VIEFECLGCGTTFDVSESLAGKVIKCRECHQPGRVKVPFDSVVRVKGIGEKSEKSEKPEKSSSGSGSSPLAQSLKGSYQCPFCSTRVLWEWRRIWTPASTLLLLAGLYANLFLAWWGYNWAYQKASTATVSQVDAEISSGRLIWVIVGLGVAVVLDVMSFRLVWEWRQVCPRCGIRGGG
jgi:DNA-directed RNA polymerase subunit RPC12/RpoP